MPELSKRPIAEIFADQAVIDQALKEAFEEAVRRHRQARGSMVFWHEGQVIRMPAEQVAVGGGDPSA
jgi:hypothetical protein